MSRKNIVALAVFTYLFLAPFTYHPDIKVISYQASFLFAGVGNIYSFLVSNPGAASAGPFVYPPLAYFFYGLLAPVIKALAGDGFADWLVMGNDAVGVSHIFRYLFAIKLPNILIFLATGSLLARFFDDANKKKLALIAWFFNPVSIYIVAFMAQIDVVAVFLTLAALYVASKRPGLASFFLGLGAAVKTYPLLLIPFVAATAHGGWKQKVKIAVLGLLPYALAVLPFAGSKAFIESTLVSGLSQRLFYLALPFGFGEQLLLVPLFLLFLLFLAFTRRFGKEILLPFYFFAVTSTVVFASHFHPQWTLWCLPFAIILVIKGGVLDFQDSKLAILSGVLSWMGIILLYNDTFLSWGLVSPMDPGLLLLPTINSLVTGVIDANLALSIFHTTLLGSVLWLSVRSFLNEKH